MDTVLSVRVYLACHISAILNHQFCSPVPSTSSNYQYWFPTLLCPFLHPLSQYIRTLLFFLPVQG